MSTTVSSNKVSDNRIMHTRSSRLRIDYFLHQSFLDSPDRLHRARVLASALCTIIGISLLVALILTVTHLPTHIRVVGIPIALIQAIGFAVLLVKFKRDGSYDLCSNAAIWITLACIISATFLTGGMSESPIAQVLVVLSLLAFFFGGIRVGRIATIFIGAVIVISLLLEHNGLHFSQISTAAELDVTRAVILLISTSVLAALAFFYEYTAAALREERDKEHWKVMQLAQTDSLTGLANRRAFDDILTERIERFHAVARENPFALCYLDLDGFKAINDRHGHDVGDQVLRAVSIRLRSALRGNDIIGRQGGDEFMLLLDQLDAAPALAATAQRFLKIMAQPIETSAGLLGVGGSFGVAIFPHHGSNAEMLKKAADAAMYEAKRTHVGWRMVDEDLLRSIQLLRHE